MVSGADVTAPEEGAASSSSASAAVVQQSQQQQESQNGDEPVVPEESTPDSQQPAGDNDEEDRGDGDKKELDTATDATTESAVETKDKNKAPSAGTPIVSSSKKNRPPYKYDPNKITLRFLFANRDGLTVTIECNPSDTIGEVKGALISVWPEDMPQSGGGDNIRLICMGKGYLMPDTRTLDDCQVPVFKTHPTPINVSVKPDVNASEDSHNNSKKKGGSSSGADGGAGAGGNGASSDPTANAASTSQGCACILL